jgi:CrcB protein
MTDMIKNILLAGLGGFIGTVMRYLPYQFIKFNNNYFITLGINILGSLLIGIFAGYCFKNQFFSQHWSVFLITGICGGFTTFSAFSLENVQLLMEGKLGASLMYILISIVLSFGVTYLGYKLTAA